MANVNSPNGFQAIRTLSGSNIPLQEVALKTTNSAIGRGDLVTQAAGFVDIWASGAVYGVAAEYKAANAGSGATIKVYTSPDIVFEGQTDAGTGTLTTQAAIGKNATIIVNAPNATTGVSTSVIDESSGATGGGSETLPVKVVGLYAIPGNSFGQYNRLEFVLNNDVFKGGTGTAGA